MFLIKDRFVCLNIFFEDFVVVYGMYYNCVEDECDIDEFNEYYNVVE